MKPEFKVGELIIQEYDRKCVKISKIIGIDFADDSYRLEVLYANYGRPLQCCGFNGINFAAKKLPDNDRETMSKYKSGDIAVSANGTLIKINKVVTVGFEDQIRYYVYMQLRPAAATKATLYADRVESVDATYNPLSETEVTAIDILFF